MIGQTISHYRITEKLGEGGMGVVYKAQDTKLDRTVALKFLAAHLLKDEESRKRFQREAKAAASLDHPNICTVHAIEEADGRTFIAMAFVEGQSLDKRIEPGPLKIPEALDIAQQIAKDLEAAHEKGVDDKGQVTVMDFGLALLTEGSKLTALDTTLGTVAYMSPEQAQGAKVDHRTDIWALGGVLYEMVSGRRPFQGEYDQALLYEIVHEEYEPITGVRAGVPMELEVFVGKCLAKNREERYKDAGDLAVDLKSLLRKLESGKSAVLKTAVTGGAEHAAPSPALSGSASPELASSPAQVAPGTQGTGTETSAPARVSHFARQILPWLLLCIAAAILAATWLRWPEPAPPAPLRRFAFRPGPDVGFPVISPNGKYIAYTTGRGTAAKLWVQDLARDETREIAGGGGARSPMWSPGSDSIAFFAEEDLKRISLDGGPAIRVCQALRSGSRSTAAWSPDGRVIVFSSGIPSMLSQVSAGGGASEPLPTVVDSGVNRGSFPHFLPLARQGRPLLFATQRGLAIQDLETGKGEIIVANARQPVYSPSGHILFRRSGAPGLWAASFSLETLKLMGEPFAVSPEGSFPSVAGDGTLVYLEGSGRGQHKLLSRERTGQELEEIGRIEGLINGISVSPDGQHAALEAFVEGNLDIWVQDRASGVNTRLTFTDRNDGSPAWSPSGDQVAFFSRRRDGNADIYVKSSDGSGEAKAVVSTPLDEWPSGWSPDGDYLLYHTRESETRLDLWYLKLSGENSGGERVPFLQTPFDEKAAQFSPGGRFVAYSSDESGRFEIYVRPFPKGTGKWQVSSNGGNHPRWGSDGRELFYVSGDELIFVPVTLDANFSAKSPASLFEDRFLSSGSFAPPYDVSADGRSFLVREQIEDAQEPVIRVVQNWFEEFRDRERQ